MFRRRLSWLMMALALVGLIAAGVALAKSKAKLHLTNPGTVKLHTPYSVTAKGKASGKANHLVGFAGPGLKCKKKEKAELKAHSSQILPAQTDVHGKFTYTWTFTAGSVGTWRVCAYVINGPSGHTYAHASVKYKVTS